MRVGIGRESNYLQLSLNRNFFFSFSDFSFYAISLQIGFSSILIARFHYCRLSFHRKLCMKDRQIKVAITLTSLNSNLVAIRFRGKFSIVLKCKSALKLLPGSLMSLCKIAICQRRMKCS